MIGNLLHKQLLSVKTEKDITGMKLKSIWVQDIQLPLVFLEKRYQQRKDVYLGFDPVYRSGWFLEEPIFVWTFRHNSRDGMNVVKYGWDFNEGDKMMWLGEHQYGNSMSALFSIIDNPELWVYLQARFAEYVLELQSAAAKAHQSYKILDIMFPRDSDIK